jgi:hypothetical protein
MPSRPDVPRILQGRSADDWWRFLPPEERRALRIAVGGGQVATDPERAAELITYIRRETSPGRVAHRAALLPVSIAIMLLVMPLPGYFEVSTFIVAAAWSALIWTTNYRHLRRIERRNLAVLDRFVRGEPVAQAPATWTVLGPAPRTYRRGRRIIVIEWVLRVMMSLSVVFVASSNGASISFWAGMAAAAVVMPLAWRKVRLVLRGTRNVSEITISPEWVEFPGAPTAARRWSWDQVAARHIWLSMTKQLTIASPDGVRFTGATSSLTDFDEFLSLVLASIPENRIDRSRPKALERLLQGVRVPTRDEDLQPPPPPHGADRVRLYVTLIVVLTATMVVVTGIGSLVSHVIT